MSPAVLAQDAYVVAEWEAVTGSDLSGYRVYLAMDPSVFNLTPQQARSSAVTRVVSSGNTETTFTGLDAGRMYYVGVTSFDASGNESGFSNVSAAEPCMLTNTGSVSLQWEGGGAREVSGYRVYVSEDAGVFSRSPREARRLARTREEPAGSLGTSIRGLEAGRTYHVAVTTLDAGGVESGFSEVTTTLAGVAPTLCSVYPEVVSQGSTVSVKAYGGNFDAEAGVDFGPGVTVSGVNASGAPDRLNLTVEVDALAPVDTRDVTVTNLDGSTHTGLNLFEVSMDVGRADVNGSNRIDGGDMIRVAAAFTARVGDARYGTGVDLNVDGVVDGTDLSLLIVHFGAVGPY